MNKIYSLIKAVSVVMCIVVIAGIFGGCDLFGDKKPDKTTTKATTTTTQVSTEPSTMEEETSETTTETTTTTTTTTTQPNYKDGDSSFPYLLKSYSTYYNSGNKNRTTNLQVASRSINNLVIPSGGTFSFNSTVGKRTAANGFKVATVINGGEYEEGLGGGICQVSTTIFQCALRSNMGIVSRSPHTLAVAYVDTGGDAAVQWGSKDFKFKNTYGCSIRIQMYCSGGKLTCEIYAAEDVSVGNVKIKITGGGQDYTLTRYVDGVKNYTTKSHYKKPANLTPTTEEVATTEATTLPPETTTEATTTTTTTTTEATTTEPTTTTTTTTTTTEPSTEQSTEPSNISEE